MSGQVNAVNAFGWARKLLQSPSTPINPHLPRQERPPASFYTDKAHKIIFRSILRSCLSTRYLFCMIRIIVLRQNAIETPDRLFILLMPRWMGRRPNARRARNDQALSAMCRNPWQPISSSSTNSNCSTIATNLVAVRLRSFIAIIIHRRVPDPLGGLQPIEHRYIPDIIANVPAIRPLPLYDPNSSVKQPQLLLFVSEFDSRTGP